MGQIDIESNLLERNGGEHQNGRAADLFEAIDFLIIILRFFGQALARFGDQFVAFAVDGCLDGAGFGAGSNFARALPVEAKIAFPHPRRNNLIPFVSGDLERTGFHAIAATHALIRVIYHRPERRFRESPYRTDRSASRLIAMHAQFAAEMIAKNANSCQLMG